MHILVPNYSADAQYFFCGGTSLKSGPKLFSSGKNSVLLFRGRNY